MLISIVNYLRLR